MSETTIEWTRGPNGEQGYSFNPWVGCSKVSPACDLCYAESWAKRAGHPELWRGERRRTSAAYWRQPLKWNREAAAAGERRRVFCASLADVFDNEVDPQWRSDLFELIEQTPNLDWLLLTKRIGNVEKLCGGVSSWPNVWLGATICNQKEADRDIPKLLATPARVRFLSIEPMLGPINLLSAAFTGAESFSAMGRIDWIIVGGESGPHARPMHPQWVRNIRDQCAVSGVPFHFKQWGEWLPICETPAVPVYDRSTDREWHVGRRSVVLQLDGTQEFAFPRGAMTCIRMGKRAAGRLLDGREWNGSPQASA